MSKTKEQLIAELREAKKKISEMSSSIAEYENREKCYIKRINDYRNLITEKDRVMMEKAQRIGALEDRNLILFTRNVDANRKKESIQKELDAATSEAQFLSDEYNKVVCGSVWSFIKLKFNMWADDTRKSMDIAQEE